MKKIYSGRHLFSYVQRRNKKILRKILPKMLFFLFLPFPRFALYQFHSSVFCYLYWSMLVYLVLPSFVQQCQFFFQRFAGFFRSLVEKKEASPIKRYWNDRAGVGGLEFVVSFFFLFFFVFLLFVVPLLSFTLLFLFAGTSELGRKTRWRRRFSASETVQQKQQQQQQQQQQ